MDNSWKSSVRNILIIKLSSMGDVIHTLPVPQALKTLYPGARISFLVNRQYEEILTGNPYIDEILLFDRKFRNHFFKSIFSLMKLVRKMRKESFDLVIDLQGLLRSGLISWASNGRNVIGLGNAREGSLFFYNQVIPADNAKLHAVDRYLLIPKTMGWEEKPQFNIKIDKKDKVFVEDFIKAEKVKSYLKLIGIQPVARWKTKEWSGANFAKLADLIQQNQEYQVVFLGSREELLQVQKIVRQMKTLPIIATGKVNLKQLAALLKKCEILITNDSGPMHLAAALNIPVIALFGATDFRRTGPYGDQHLILHKDIFCSPCLNRNCLNKNRPMECMETITPEEVFEALKKIVKY
ncbi:MAG: lipopolysaccharide heptosyltransferase II [Nitrospiria bacterium]